MKRMNDEELRDKTMNEIEGMDGGNDSGTSVELPMYAPNMNITARSYQASEQFADLEANFKERCNEFFSSANPDKYNSDYMDAVIEETAFDAIRNIEAQRRNHERLIVNGLDMMHKGDYSNAKSKLQQFLEDREEIQKELAKWKRVLWKGTALEEEV